MARKEVAPQSKTGLVLSLTGDDGNAFFVLGKAIKLLKRSKYSEEEIAEFKKEATSGDYDNLLRVCMDWFEVE